MYHVYEAESKVTAAERAYDAVNAKAQSVRDLRPNASPRARRGAQSERCPLRD